MAEYIERESAVAVILEKQKELCPVGLYGRSHAYGSDREKYDNWDEIIDALENIPAADVSPVVHGKWVDNDAHPIAQDHGMVSGKCSVCGLYSGLWYVNRPYNFCPFCGAKMKGDNEN